MQLLRIGIWHRRVSQTLFFGLWVFLFWRIARQDFGGIPPDLFLSTDPLLSALAMAAARAWVPAMLNGLALVVLTAVFGRFFCGWVCPLGTLLDAVARLWRGRSSKVLQKDSSWRRVKYYVLIALCVGALTGSQLVFLGDPLVILFRALATGLAPSAGIETAVLPFALLLIIVGLCGITHRFWCRYLCPLGALYGATARFSIIRRRRAKGCDGCKGEDQPGCEAGCPMGASPVKKLGSPEECVRSMNCRDNCSKDAIEYPASVPLPDKRENTVDLDRRSFVLSLGAGAMAGMSSTRARAGAGTLWSIVRPPMVIDDEAFLALCVRCGHCMRSCPTGTLQPLLLEAGFYGLWTPAITARIDGCKEDCNACSVVCPTGAIPEFGPERPQKWSVKMGHVLFEPHLCISYAPDAVKPCLKCVEVCPNRAIEIDWKAQPVRPKAVDYARCVGCGLCEKPCRKMVVGRPALTLTSNGVGTPTVLVVDPKPQLPDERIAK